MMSKTFPVATSHCGMSAAKRWRAGIACGLFAALSLPEPGQAADPAADPAAGSVVNAEPNVFDGPRLTERREDLVPAAFGPRPVADGLAVVGEDNTVWAPRLGRFLVGHEPPVADPAVAITTRKDAVGALLQQWQREGTAAGLHGFLYDNHDAGHSPLDVTLFPQLGRVDYCEAAKQRGLHSGLQVGFLHNLPVIGNSSMAATQGPLWRSLPRQAMVHPLAMMLMADQYANNHLYVYPEHKDHDPESEGGFGDVYPANVPYVVISQGSSYSDKPILAAIAATIAAFRPETQQFILKHHLLAPTVQMILRSSRTPVRSRDDYLSGAAHPAVFDMATLDVERMVRAAHDLAPEDVPPLVRLTVVSEEGGAATEKLFDTVSAVARVVRAPLYRRRMVVSVAQTKDVQGRPLTFAWRLLRGDADRVRIEPLDEAGTRAEIVVDWHERGARPEGALPSSRVDVGVFADGVFAAAADDAATDDAAAEGRRLSAPAFVTWYFPASERRTYEDVPATADPDRADPINGGAPRRIVSIERLPADAPGSYADPLIVPPGRGDDVFRYDDAGVLLGWTRTADGKREAFGPDGRRIEDADAASPP